MTNRAEQPSATTLLAQLDALVVYGTSQNVSGYGGLHGPPWHLVNTLTADKDVGCLGEQLGCYPTSEAAIAAREDHRKQLVEEWLEAQRPRERELRSLVARLCRQLPETDLNRVQAMDYLKRTSSPTHIFRTEDNL